MHLTEIAGAKLAVALGLLTAGAIAVAILAAAPVADPDLWGLMAMGRETLHRGWPLVKDPFAYVPTKSPLVYHEWLSGVLFYLLLEWLGSWALKVLSVLLGLLAVGFAALAGRGLGGTSLSFPPVFILALLSMQRGYSPVRAQAFTFVFFALFIFLLEEAERGRGGALLLIPAVTAVWVNLHGGFVAGLGLLLVYIASHLRSREKPWLLVIVCAATILATLISPYGLDYWRYLHRALLMARPLIPEWAPLPLDLTTAWPFKALLLLGALAVVMVPVKHWRGIAVLAVTAFFGLRHVRHIPFFAVASLAYLPGVLAPLVEGVAKPLSVRVARRPVIAMSLASAALGGLTLAAVFQLTQFTSWELEVPASDYPVGAVDFLRLNGLKGNLVTPYNWGEYVLWKLYPDVRVSFDGRYETVYPARVTADYFNFANGTGDWRRLLREYPTEMVLVDQDYAMARLMEKEPGWTAVYRDRTSALYLPTARSAGPWRLPLPLDGTIP